MLGLISIIVNGCDNSVFSENQGNGCCIGGEMPACRKNLLFKGLLNEQLSGFFSTWSFIWLQIICYSNLKLCSDHLGMF